MHWAATVAPTNDRFLYMPMGAWGDRSEFMLGHRGDDASPIYVGPGPHTELEEFNYCRVSQLGQVTGANTVWDAFYYEVCEREDLNPGNVSAMG